MNIVNQLKRCCHCKANKPINDFNKNRSTKDGCHPECRICVKIAKKDYYWKNHEKMLAKGRINYYADVNKSRKKKREYANQNRESENSRAKTWYKDNKDRKKEYDKIYVQSRTDQRRLASKRFRDNHPERKRADTAYRRAKRIQATPPWIDLIELRKIYEDCPEGFHVDHIVPLKGRNVCGLHVPWNLQYLSAKDNLLKSNHYSYGED